MNPDPMADDELRLFFDRLFPCGFAGPDVVREIAPEGWERSPLLACAHPSPQRVFEEQLAVHHNLVSLFKNRPARASAVKAPEPLPEPTLAKILEEWEEKPVLAAEEIIELVGTCLWDVFSDNNEVIAGDGRVVDIGSFRGSSAFLDEYLAGPGAGFDYGDSMRFYMGSIWINGRADLTPVYRMIFRRLKAMGADWVFQFPEIHLVDFSGMSEAGRDPLDCSPSKAIAEEQARKEREVESEPFRKELAESNREARARALDLPPPERVLAYEEIYGREPKGWPPA